MKLTLLIISFFLLFPTSYSQNYPSGKKYYCHTSSKEAFFNNDYGEQLLSQKKFDKAIKPFMKAVAIDSLYCEAWSNLAISYEYVGELDKSFESAIKAIRINSAFELPWITLTNLFILKGDNETALNTINGFKEMYPDNPEGYYQCANILILIGNFEEAKVNYSKAKEIYENKGIKPFIQNNLLEATIEFNLKNYTKSEEILHQIFYDYRKSAHVNYMLGISIYKNDSSKIRKAKKHIKRAIRWGYPEDEITIEIMN